MFKEVTIDGLDGALRGLFEAEFQDQRRQVAVPGAVVGDVLDVKIVAVSQHHPTAYGEIAKIHKRGPEFEAPPCPHAAPLRGRCGGCPAMHLSPPLREQAKLKSARAILEPLGVEITWQPAPAQQGYRNRSNFAVRRRDNPVMLGSFAPRSHALAPMTGCLAVRPALTAVHRQLEALLTAHQVPVDTDQGALRWVSIREAQHQVVVELIVRDSSAPWIAAVVAAIGQVDGVVGVGLSVNDDQTNAIRRGPTEMVIGDGILREQYGQVQLQIPPGAFAQLNVDVASMIYERARQWTGRAQVVWDLYCGLGGLGINAVAGVKDALLWGLEEVAPALNAARANAELAGVNAQFDVVDLADPVALATVSAPEGAAHPQWVMVNPPRKGLGPLVRDWLAGNPMGADGLIYMSCDPKTFARDAKAWIAGGWELTALEVYDMLPMTGHVEVLGCFHRAT